LMQLLPSNGSLGLQPTSKAPNRIRLKILMMRADS
jgi:hypothetical protein